MQVTSLSLFPADIDARFFAGNETYEDVVFPPFALNISESAQLMVPADILLDLEASS